MIVGRDDSAGERMVERALEHRANEAYWRPTDVTDRVDVDGLVDHMLGRFGRIDVLSPQRWC